MCLTDAELQMACAADEILGTWLFLGGSTGVFYTWELLNNKTESFNLLFMILQPLDEIK